VRTRLQQFGHGKRGPVGHRLQALETGPPRGPKRISLSSSPRISGASSETLVPKSPSPEPRDPPAHRRPAWRSPAPACTSMTTSSVRLAPVSRIVESVTASDFARLPGGFVFGIVQTRAPWPATCRGSSPPCASSTTGHMVMISLHFFVFLKNCVCIFASLLFVFVTTDMIWVFTVISYTNSNASSNWIYRKTINKMKLNLNMLWKASCDSYYLICHHISKVKYL